MKMIKIFVFTKLLSSSTEVVFKTMTNDKNSLKPFKKMSIYISRQEQ